MIDLRNERVLITGGSGFVGTNLRALLTHHGVRVIAPSRAEFDMTSQLDVRRMFALFQPTVVFHLAGLVGGIETNRKRPADFHYQNLVMGALVMHTALQAGAKKFITLIGGWSYPAGAVSPISEECLLTGYPQAESAPYSLAKAMSVVQAQAYRQQYGFNTIVLVPGNMYGPCDNFDPGTGHVIPALIRRFVEADDDAVTVWGTGKAIRDFVYVTDVCEAVMIAAETYDGPMPINISSGVPTTIQEVADQIARATGFIGRIVWDASKPDGQAVKVFDVRRQRDVLHHECTTTLWDGLDATVAWYRANT